MAKGLPALGLLNHIDIESPCGVAWNTMQAKGAVRHCATCGKDVYDLIDMSAAEAARLVATPGPLPCMRIARRADGGVITADTAKGWRERAWLQMRRRAPWIGWLLAIVLLPGCARMMQYGRPFRTVTLGEKIKALLPEKRVGDALAEPISRP